MFSPEVFKTRNKLHSSIKKEKITCKCLYLSGKVYKCMSKAKILDKRGLTTRNKSLIRYIHKGVSGWVDFGTSEVLGKAV